ncbi:MAG TPA: tetratricopeptide repeat protein [Pyrinomonadaceae bacterium]|nr:tetratricopeptide repeat protein [Pyrinomonadaceae bacterium]
MKDTKEVKVSDEAKRKDKLAYLQTIGSRASRDLNSEELIKIAEQILELDSDNAQAHFWLGFACHRLRKDKVIIENHYRNAIICNPKMSYAYSNFAMLIMYDANRQVEAKNYLLKAIQYNQNNADAYKMLGDIKSNDGSSLNDVEECYRMAIFLKPSFSEAHSGLGNALLRYEFRTKEAKASLEKAIELDPNNVHAYECLAYLYEHQEKDVVKTEQYLRKINNLKPNDAAFHLQLGLILHKQNRFYEAIEFCQKAAMLNERIFLPLLVLGSIYRIMGYDDESKKYLMLAEIVIKKYGFEKTEGEIYNLACLNSLLGNKKEALKYLKSAIEASSTFKETAKNDPDFDFVKNTPQFKKITET